MRASAHREMRDADSVAHLRFWGLRMRNGGKRNALIH
jgi:hypothetical protein